MTSKFEMTSNTEFYLEFINGWGISVKIGFGSLSSNRTNEINHLPRIISKSAEVMVIDNKDNWKSQEAGEKALKMDFCGNSIPHCSTTEVAKLIAWIVNQKRVI